MKGFLHSLGSGLLRCSGCPRLTLLSLLPALLLVACVGDREDARSLPGTATIPVAQEFEAFYTQYGGRRFFGDPITEPFRVHETGPLIQYFQAMRLEFHERPGVADDREITISPLGEWALEGMNQITLLPALQESPSRYFPETGLAVQGDFLAFYEANHGSLLLGPPISTQLDREQLRVQYFRNGRLDRYPELPPDQRIRVGFLGQAHLDAEMAFTYRQALSRQFVPATSVNEVKVYGNVRYPILYAGDEQLLYITTLTPEGQSVSGLKISVMMIYDDVIEQVELELVDNQNRIQTPLTPSRAAPGQQVDIVINVLSPGDKVLGSDNLTFRTWW